MVKGCGPRPLFLCGPSGTGKSTLLNRLLNDYPNTFGFSVSHTTRKPRPGEIDGVHYHFTDKEAMQSAVSGGEFLESATFSGNMYGTSIKAVSTVQEAGKICVADVDMEGIKQIRKSGSLNPLFIFISPPSMEELEKRLRNRNTENDESLAARLEVARKEMEFGNTPGIFHKIILNDNVDKAYEALKEFIITEINKQRTEGMLFLK